MKKIINILVVAVAVLSVTVGCYNDCDTPAPAYVYTDGDFSDCEIISIKGLKDDYASLLTTSGNEALTENWVIRGKVISTDEEGSIYKSLYILDHDDDGDGEAAAIELRLFASNYVSYPVGTMVYVKLNGLSIGDYGGVLSIGALSTVADTEYPHTTIEGRVMLAEHIFSGERLDMQPRDTLVITGSTYSSIDILDAVSRLVRIEEVTSCVGQTASWGYGNTFPSYFSSSSEMFDWDSSIEGDLATPTLAYYGVDPTDPTATASIRYYGSSWYSYDPSGSDYSQGQYVLRISGYAHFRETPIPDDGALVTITGILSRYNSAIQLNLNYGTDLVVVE